jgi:hypothetical protein
MEILREPSSDSPSCLRPVWILQWGHCTPIGASFRDWQQNWAKFRRCESVAQFALQDIEKAMIILFF